MRHDNSVFHGLQKHIPWAEFERLVDAHGADRRVRKLTTRSQFLAMLFGQLAGAGSLRDIEAGLASQSAGLYHLGMTAPARSTLADANTRRPAALFAELFAHMAKAACRRIRRQMPAFTTPTLLPDATRLSLTSLSQGWVSTVSGKRAVKLHVVYDLGAAMPLEAGLSDQRVNDITPAKALQPEPGATYVFDLGYYDFAWWAALDAAGCRIVSRLKSNTDLAVTAVQPVPKDGAILSDRIGLLPRRMARSRKNPFADPVREIVVRLKTGKTIRIVSNDLDAPAKEIADLYKARWQIELFFKWIKQNLKIGHFLGASENAVRIQIFVALIAFILLKLAHDAQRAVPQPSTFRRLVRLNLMHRRPIDALGEPRKPPVFNPRQMT
ncbi:IS4 family transposase, partial [Jiella marina]|uniref:IS4 family transposase n=1 Tax=Jiella sp. LLJ827 TaxID=2917712 RepID=UPI002100F7EA